MNILLENLEKIDEILEKINELDNKISGEKRWLNVSETAIYLGYSKDHIHKLKTNHFVYGTHFYKKAGKVLFDRIELDKWVMSYSNHLKPNEIVDSVLSGILK